MEQIIAFKSGNFLGKWGTPGSGDGQFSSPAGIAIDSTSGNIFIADRANDRIQVFDSNGNFITKWGSRGSADGQFNNPIGVAVGADGRIYVTDEGNARIQVFSSTGGV
jgi:DNA-binding beta-propeller fold protein YncE